MSTYEYQASSDPNRTNNGANIAGNNPGNTRDQIANGLQVGNDPYDPNRTGADRLPQVSQPFVNTPQPGQADLSSSSGLNPLSQLQPFNYDLNSVNPETDLDYNAFLRGMGFNSAQAQAQAAMQRANIESGLQIQLPEIQRQEGLGITSANNAAAAAGGARSSARLVANDNVTNAANYQTALANQNAATQNAQIGFGLQNTMAGFQQQQIEQDLAARQRQLELQNNQAAYKNALIQYGLG